MRSVTGSAASPLACGRTWFSGNVALSGLAFSQDSLPLPQVEDPCSGRVIEAALHGVVLCHSLEFLLRTEFARMIGSWGTAPDDVGTPSCANPILQFVNFIWQANDRWCFDGTEPPAFPPGPTRVQWLQQNRSQLSGTGHGGIAPRFTRTGLWHTGDVVDDGIAIDI